METVELNTVYKKYEVSNGKTINNRPGLKKNGCRRFFFYFKSFLSNNTECRGTKMRSISCNVIHSTPCINTFHDTAMNFFSFIRKDVLLVYIENCVPLLE